MTPWLLLLAGWLAGSVGIGLALGKAIRFGLADDRAPQPPAPSG